LRIILLLLLVILTDAATAQQKKHGYQSGDVFPDLTFIPVNGDTVTTSMLKGKKFLLMFNRYVSCPLCNFRAYEIMQLYDSLADTQFVILSVYESERKLLQQYAEQEKIPFMLIPDPEMSLYKLFKIQKSWWKSFLGLFNHYTEKHSRGKDLFKNKYERDGNLNRIGADFLINENGVIDVAYYGKFAGDHLPVEAIRKWVRQQ
jgi:peroxiredoxin Q/BCP